MSISLKVVRWAAVCLAWTSRSAVLLRIMVMGTRSTRRSIPARGCGGAADGLALLSLLGAAGAGAAPLGRARVHAPQVAGASLAAGRAWPARLSPRGRRWTGRLRGFSIRDQCRPRSARLRLPSLPPPGSPASRRPGKESREPPCRSPARRGSLPARTWSPVCLSQDTTVPLVIDSPTDGTFTSFFMLPDPPSVKSELLIRNRIRLQGRAERALDQLLLFALELGQRRRRPAGALLPAEVA